MVLATLRANGQLVGPTATTLGESPHTSSACAWGATAGATASAAAAIAAAAPMVRIFMRVTFLSPVGVDCLLHRQTLVRTSWSFLGAGGRASGELCGSAALIRV